MKKNSIYKVILLGTLLSIILILCISCKKYEDKDKDSKYTKELELEKVPYGYAVKKYKGENIDKFIVPEKYKDEDIVKIDENAFFKSDVKEVQLPNTIKRIEYKAFAQCSLLKKINLPDKIEYIGDYAFFECDLSEVSLPKDLMEIGEGAFKSCICIKSVEIPDTIKKISKVTFSGCEKLTNVKIGKNVESIGSNAFYGCKSLKKIYIPASVQEMKKCVFSEVQDCEISCEAKSKPEGWDKEWIDYEPIKCKVLWGQPKPTK